MPIDPSSPERPEPRAEEPLPEALARLQESQGTSFRGAGRYAGVGLQFVGALLLFLFIGQWLDRRFGTDPVFLYLGVAVGAGGAFYSMYRSLMADQRRDELERQGRAKQ
jgi:ATP synthase protein I